MHMRKAGAARDQRTELHMALVEAPDLL